MLKFQTWSVKEHYIVYTVKTKCPCLMYILVVCISFSPLKWSVQCKYQFRHMTFHFNGFIRVNGCKPTMPHMILLNAAVFHDFPHYNTIRLYCTLPKFDHHNGVHKDSSEFMYCTILYL